MASFCNPILRPPTAIPAKNPISNGAVLRTASPILRTTPLFLTAKALSKSPKATPSQKYVYPEPIPEFAAAVFSEFLHKDYGGPGTLLIEPFTDMMVALKEKNLPGAPLAARASLLWAQNHVDQDWEIWNSKSHK